MTEQDLVYALVKRAEENRRQLCLKAAIKLAYDESVEGMQKQAQLGRAIGTFGRAVLGRGARALSTVAAKSGLTGRMTQALGQYGAKYGKNFGKAMNAAKGQFLASRPVQLLTGSRARGIETALAGGAKGEARNAAIAAARQSGRRSLQAADQAARGAKGYLDRAGLDQLRRGNQKAFDTTQRVLAGGIDKSTGLANLMGDAEQKLMSRDYVRELGKIRATRLGAGAAALGAGGLGLAAATGPDRYGNGATAAGRGSYRDYFG